MTLKQIREIINLCNEGQSIDAPRLARLCGDYERMRYEANCLKQQCDILADFLSRKVLTQHEREVLSEILKAIDKCQF